MRRSRTASPVGARSDVVRGMDDLELRDLLTDAALHIARNRPDDIAGDLEAHRLALQLAWHAGPDRFNDLLGQLTTMFSLSVDDVVRYMAERGVLDASLESRVA